MIHKIENAKIAIVGGGRFCEKLLRHLFDDHFKARRPQVLGVADINENAAGIAYARSIGIYTCGDYRELCGLDGLETIIELTWDLELADKISRIKPARVELIDHQDSRYLWDLLRLEIIHDDAMNALDAGSVTVASARECIDLCFRKTTEILMQRNYRFKGIETQLSEKEKTLSQIIQGSSIPTFVINREHVVTHWNHALEVLTGCSAATMVGTRDHWKAFRKKQRPIMADVILDQLETGEIDHYYGSKWRPSTLVEGGYEAEEFFEHLGSEGRWLFFTAAPIRASDGSIIGAIETLWDNTENRRAETERRNYTRRIEESERTLGQIIQGSAIPTFVLNRDHVITHWNRALEKLTGCPAARMVGTRHQWEAFWESERPTMADVIMDPHSEIDIRAIYGERWRKSNLIDEAYEAEAFFPKLGEAGRWCWFTATPLKTSDGVVVGAIQTLWDTTPNRQTEMESRRLVKQLEEMEQTLTQIVQASTVPTFLINRNHIVTHWNRALEKLTGFTAGEIVGTNRHWKPFRRRARPLMADMVLDRLETSEISQYYGTAWRPSPLVEDGYEAEEFFEHLGDRGRWLVFTAVPVKALDGSLVGAVETLRDVTEKKRAESRRRRDIIRIQEIENRLDQMVQGSSMPTFVLNAQHVITHWNRALERLSGYPASQQVGTGRQWVPFWDGERPMLADVILDHKSEQEIWDLYGDQWKKSELIDGAYEAEIFIPKLGNEGKWCRFTAAPIKAADGSVIGAIETLWDATHRKMAEVDRRQYTRKLEEDQRELSQIIQGTTIPTFVLNREHVITHWNLAMEKLTGYPSAEMVGTRRQWVPFWDSDRPTMADVILDRKSEQEIWDLYGGTWKKSVLIEGGCEAEIFFPRLGRGGRWCWFTAAPIKSADGTVVGAIETLWDTTAARKAEVEQQWRNRELATLCSIYTALNAPLTLRERIEGAVMEIRDFMKADSVCLYMSADDGGFDLSYFNACYADPGFGQSGPETQTEIMRQVTFTGKPIVHSDGDPPNQPSDEGQTPGPTFAYIPISARERQDLGVMRIEREVERFSAEELHLLDLMSNRIGVSIENALLHEEVIRKSNFQAKLIKSANDGIIATDEKWKTVIFNPAAERIFGYAAGDVLAKVDARDYVPEAVQQAIFQPKTEGEARKRLPWAETNIKSRTGELIPVRFSGSVLRENKNMMGTVTFFQDLREIKRLERELVNSERLAAVGQTVAGMAHCIKNILHGFKGGSYLVDVGLERDNIDKLKSGWAMIQRNITRTSDLVMDLLSYSKEREPAYERCHPNEIAADVCELLDTLARDHEIALVRSFSGAIKPMMMDPRTIHRCLMNLVTNAIDACMLDPGADKDHRVTVATAIEGTGTIRFEVKDNGCGMSAEVRAKLFSSFFSTKGVKGTGLGLLVTAKLVEEHKGTIDVDSTEGEGTTFTLRFPARPTDAASR